MDRTQRASAAWKALLLLGFLAFLLSPVMAVGSGLSVPDEDVVVVGGQDDEVDADQGRDSKFEQDRDIPSGLVLDYLRWSWAGDGMWLQLKAWDATQLDERFLLRAGLGKKVRFRAMYQSTPHAYGDDAIFVLGRSDDNRHGPTYRIGDFIQQDFQDPDGNGTDFYTSGAETANDNPLVQGMMNDLLTGENGFSLDSRRRSGSLGFTILANRNWSFDVNVSQETRDGLQALGSGTYQRISDVNGDGDTDYDYFFSVRGIELPGIVDYRTTRFTAAANYQNRRWFLRVGADISEFENNYQAITYDNPFWFDGIDATSGSRRGLWEEGRVSLEPSNEAWNVSLAGGVNLPRRTRITASVSVGEHSQDDNFLPITTNPATIATADINRDGFVDGDDDPTRAPAKIAGMASSIGGIPTIGDNLDAKSDITALNFRVTSRPVKNLTLTGRYRSYEYEGKEGIQVVPARAEYVESHIKLDFKGSQILHVPLSFKRETLGAEASYRFARGFKLKGFYKRKSYEYERYRDTNGDSSRESGSRAVEGTDDDSFGVTALFAAGSWFSGRATVQTAERDFKGDYTTGFSGENTTVRQFDIANRDRDALNLQLDFMPTSSITLGVGFDLYYDDYPDSDLGLQSGETTGANLSFNYDSEGGVNVFAYADWSEWDADMHLRTKCSNCAVPPGFSPWDVPNYDWFSDYTDTSVSVGAGVSFDAGKRTRIEILANYLDAEIEQRTENPNTPRELNPANALFGEVANVALGYDFPEQKNSLLTVEFKIRHRINDRVSCGFWWLYEDFSLDDYQWDNLQPYGANFLDVDDATRALFLDSRYQDYDAHVLQVFMQFKL